MSQKNLLQQLHAAGQSFWWDALSRRALINGDILRRRDEDGMRGITSNPSIFHSAITSGSDYDEAIGPLAAKGLDEREIFWELAIVDIQDACDVLRPVYDESNAVDGYVSLEVNPHFAFETQKTFEQVGELARRVDRPNVMIKIPGTPEGIPAIQRALTEGFNINVTLLFSQQAHIDVMEAYIAAIEARVAAGLPVDRIASVASFFISRVDSMVDKRLDALPDAPSDLNGKAGIANAKLAYQNFKELFSGDRWQRLADAGARVQRPLWASTSTKNDAYSDVMYVDELIGPDTVNTMPTNTLEAFLDHGTLEPGSIEQGVPEARKLLAALEAHEISMDDVTDALLDEGVVKFEQSFDALLADLKETVGRVATRGD